MSNMKKFIAILIFCIFITDTSYGLAPWHESGEYLSTLLNTSPKSSFIDKHLAFILPSRMKFDKEFPRHVYQKYQIARDVFDRAMAHIGITEDEFFELYTDVYSDEHQTKDTWIKRKTAVLVFYVALYSAFDNTNNVGLRPFGILGNSLGEFAALIVAESLSLEDGISLFQTYCEINNQYYDSDYQIMKITGIPLKDVSEAAVVQEKTGILHVKSVNLDSNHLAISVVGIKSELQKTKEKLEKEYPSARIDIVKTGPAIPVHTQIVIANKAKWQTVIDSFDFKNPRMPIFSATGDSVLRTVEDIKTDLIYILTEPIRWDKIVDQAFLYGIFRFVYFGRKGIKEEKMYKRRMPVTEYYIDEVESIEQVKQDSLRLSGVLETFESTSELNEFIEFIVTSGAYNILFEGYSGAGKSVIIARLKEYLISKGYKVETIHLGALSHKEVLDEYLESIKVFGDQADAIPYDAINDYEKFRRFMSEVAEIRSGERAPGKVVLEGLTYKRINNGKPFTRVVEVSPETIMLFEGNIFLSEEIEGSFDVNIFCDLDRKNNLDVKRILTRAISRSTDDVSLAGYISKVVGVKRPVIDRHRKLSLNQFDIILDNTDYDRPVVMQNPKRRIPNITNLEDVIIMFRMWQHIQKQKSQTPEDILQNQKKYPNHQA